MRLTPAVCIGLALALTACMRPPSPGEALLASDRWEELELLVRVMSDEDQRLERLEDFEPGDEPGRLSSVTAVVRDVETGRVRRWVFRPYVVGEGGQDAMTAGYASCFERFNEPQTCVYERGSGNRVCDSYTAIDKAVWCQAPGYRENGGSDWKLNKEIWLFDQLQAIRPDQYCDKDHPDSAPRFVRGHLCDRAFQNAP